MSVIETEITGMRSRLQELGKRVTECSEEMKKLRAEVSYLVREMADAMTQLSEVECNTGGEESGSLVSVSFRS